MVKVLAQAGDSLADVYDVEGSIAGIENLETRDLPIVHEMGATVFSERMSLAYRRQNTASMLQTVTFDHVLVDLPFGITRILGLSVFTNTVAGRILNATVSIRDNAAQREMPIWNFDAAVDNETTARVADDGVGSSDLVLLRPVDSMRNLPSLLTSDGQPQRINEIAFRGTTQTFGAGNVIASLIVMLGHTHIGGQGISSRGLPIPGW